MTIAAYIVARLKELYPDPSSKADFPVGFSRSGAYCVAGSLAAACGLQNQYPSAWRFPGPGIIRNLLEQLGVPELDAQVASLDIGWHNDEHRFGMAYQTLEVALEKADPVKLRAVIPHELWPYCSLEEVLDATVAAQQRQEVAIELVQVKEYAR